MLDQRRGMIMDNSRFADITAGSKPGKSRITS
jgi:hypothetical protein